MRKLLHTTASSICLIAIVLWAQVAVAQHNLDHIGHEATEVCQVFANADHGKALTNAISSFAHADFDQLLVPAFSSSPVEFYSLIRSARAPPKFTL